MLSVWNNQASIKKIVCIFWQFNPFGIGVVNARIHLSSSSTHSAFHFNYAWRKPNQHTRTASRAHGISTSVNHWHRTHIINMHTKRSYACAVGMLKCSKKNFLNYDCSEMVKIINQWGKKQPSPQCRRIKRRKEKETGTKKLTTMKVPNSYWNSVMHNKKALKCDEWHLTKDNL